MIEKIDMRIKEIMKAAAFRECSYNSILTTNYSILIQTTTKINFSHGE